MNRQAILKKVKALFAVSVFAILVILTAMAGSSGIFAQHHHNLHDEFEEIAVVVDEAEHDAGRMIIEHLIDSHEWHLWTYKGHHVSIPLPIILFHKGEWHFFLSGKLSHGHHHKGFYISKEGDDKGKILRVVRDDMLDDEIIRAETRVERPVDLSITKNVLAIFISCILLVIIFTSVAGAYRRRAGQAPKGLQSLLEPIIVFVRDDIAKSSIGEKKYERYMPFLLTLFFFILLNNLLGLVPFFPGGANVTGNIAVTGVLAMFTFLTTLVSGNRNYWKHIFNTPGVPWWLKFPLPLMPIVEVVGMLTKPFVLMIRLFANITAGHTILLGFISLIFIFGKINAYIGMGVGIGFAVPFALFISLLELLVAFIQAYVFTFLSALYFGMAVQDSH
jgi:F-type H+-transporting ATPase subunit a